MKTADRRPTIDANTIVAVGQLLARHGVSLTWRACCYLSPETCAMIVADPAGFEDHAMAAAEGVSVEHYRAWKGHDYQCRATTKKKVRCRNWVEAAAGYNSAAFVPTGFRTTDPEAMYCAVHIGQ